MLKKIVRAVLLLFGLFLLLLIGLAFSSKNSQPELGYVNSTEELSITKGNRPMNRQLTECPQSPNCVATQTAQADKKLPPLAFTGSATEAQLALKELILGLRRTALISEEPGYLHFSFTTWPIPFVDDVEFLIDSAQKQIHFRSASRVGYSDLGANRARMKKVTSRWEVRQ